MRADVSWRPTSHNAAKLNCGSTHYFAGGVLSASRHASESPNHPTGAEHAELPLMQHQVTGHNRRPRRRFVGVSNLSLREGGEWVVRKEVDLYPFDAGTEEGTEGTCAN